MRNRDGFCCCVRASHTHCIKNLRTYYLRFPTGRGGRKDPMGRFRMPGPTRRTVDRKADAWSLFEPVRAAPARPRRSAPRHGKPAFVDSSFDEPPAVGGAAGGRGGRARAAPQPQPFRPFAGSHGSDSSPGSAARGRGGRGVSSACDCAARLLSLAGGLAPAAAVRVEVVVVAVVVDGLGLLVERVLAGQRLALVVYRPRVLGAWALLAGLRLPSWTAPRPRRSTATAAASRSRDARRRRAARLRADGRAAAAAAEQRGVSSPSPSRRSSSSTGRAAAAARRGRRPRSRTLRRRRPQLSPTPSRSAPARGSAGRAGGSDSTTSSSSSSSSSRGSCWLRRIRRFACSRRSGAARISSWMPCVSSDSSG